MGSASGQWRRASDSVTIATGCVSSRSASVNPSSGTDRNLQRREESRRRGPVVHRRWVLGIGVGNAVDLDRPPAVVVGRRHDVDRGGARSTPGTVRRRSTTLARRTSARSASEDSARPGSCRRIVSRPSGLNPCGPFRNRWTVRTLSAAATSSGSASAISPTTSPRRSLRRARAGRRAASAFLECFGQSRPRRLKSRNQAEDRAP